jgi:hypothetical protein
LAGGAVPARTNRGLPRLKWWQWALIAVGALVLVSIIVNGINGERATGGAAGDKPATVAEEAEDEPAPAARPVDDRAEVPALVGLTVGEARAALEAVGFVIAMPAGTSHDWVVAARTLSEGRQADAVTEVLVTEAPKPVYTLAQQNAIGKAQSYLDHSGFSRVGLIEQLDYEGYSTEEAVFGADNAGADWNAEAAEKAASYLEYSSFSRQGLYDQLAFEGFTDAEIQSGSPRSVTDRPLDTGGRTLRDGRPCARGVSLACEEVLVDLEQLYRAGDLHADLVAHHECGQACAID